MKHKATLKTPSQTTLATRLKATLGVVVLASACSGRADYPIAAHSYAADPAAVEFNGRLHVYCSNDNENGTNSYLMSSLTCFSTDDLKNWTDHGVAFRANTTSWASLTWAPSAISNQNKVYLYFANGAGSIGVATSSVPAGPFVDARGSSLINSATPGASSPTQWLFDPGAFIDDSGQAYLYFGGQYPTNSRVIRLNSNLTTVNGSAQPLDTPNFFEAAHMHKRNGIYYLTYCTRPNAGIVIGCVTNSNPTNGFVPQGTVLPNPPQNVNNNNHQSIVSYRGNWYIVYHNRAAALANGLSNAQAVYKRSLCLDAINYNANGSIQQTTPTTDGLAQLKNLDPFKRVEAETFAQRGGIKTEVCTEGGMNVMSVTNGSWVRIRGVNFGAGAAAFYARVASAGGGGNIELRLDGVNGTLVGTCNVAPTGGWQAWTTVSTNVSGASGVHDLFLKFTGGAGNLFNVNWWQFQSGLSVSAGPDQTLEFPQGTNQVTASLLGSVSAGGNPFTAAWSKLSGPGTVQFANSNAPITTVTLTGGAGAYVLQLAALSGTNSASDTVTLTVNAFVPDTTPPAVSITAPANGATLLFGSAVSVTATITDNVAVQTGELYVDGLFHSGDAAAPYVWAVSGLGLGAHTLAVRGLDAAGNAATNSVGITVSSTIPVPNTLTNIALHDAYIQTSGTTITVVDGSPLRVENNTPTRTRNTYLRFNLADIPAGATISSVILRVNNQRTTTASGTYAVYAGSSEAWVDASPGPNTLAEGLIADGAQIGGFVNPAPSSLLNIPLTNSFLTGNGAYNLVLKKTTVSPLEAELSTSENANANLRPALIVEFEVIPPDLFPPVVNFLNPTNGASHPSELPLTVTLNATDDVAVAGVTLVIDDVVVGELTSEPWIFEESPLSSGPHTLTAVARDTANKSSTNSILVTFTPPVAPTVSIVTPTNGATFAQGDAVSVVVEAADDMAITNVTFYVDNVLQGSFLAPPYSLVISNLAVGEHSLDAVATDNLELTANASITFTVIASPVTPVLTVTVAEDGGFFLDWTPADWVLEERADLAEGEWTEVPGAAPPYPLVPIEPQRFFRIRP